MFRLGTALRLSVDRAKDLARVLASGLAVNLALTGCFKFTPEVTALPSSLGVPPSTGSHLSALSGRSSTSIQGKYKLHGSLDRTSAASNTSLNSKYMIKESAITNVRANGGAL